ncbi:MAG: hypothetical protein LBV00_09250 [Propionibacteriaceae bacterium]|jgi:hypothetical protein|nr:hypothetical protein [Propionibacteriaceae bacterium]
MPRIAPWIAAVVAIAMATTLCGCTPTGQPTDPPSTIDLTRVSAARSMVEELMAAAGSTRVISVEVTRTEARLAVASDQKAVTYAWRDDTISTVDSDIDYVGQAIFDPRTFALDDLGDLFARAATEVGSDLGQKLQIVDYDDGRIYMSVTTNPETRPVFFTTDGELITSFDAADPASLAPVLAAVVAGADQVTRVGIDSDGSVYADVPAGANQTMRTTRAPQFPLRSRLRPETNQPTTFDPELVDAATITGMLERAARHLDKPLDSGVTMSIQRLEADAEPVATVTVGGRTARLTLSGVVLKQ